MSYRLIALDYLKKNLSEKRFIHVLSVEECIIEIGEKYNLDVDKLSLIALFHDMSKEKDLEWQIKKLRTQNIDENSIPVGAYHAFTAKCIYKELIDIDDESIDRAVEYHTTFTENMDDYGKALFVADYAEKTRKQIESHNLYKEIGKKSLDDLVVQKLTDYSRLDKFKNDKESLKRLHQLIKHYGG